MLQTISQSSLNMILRCAESFRRRYLEDEITPPGIALGRGSGVHKACELNHRQKVATARDLPVDELTDAARDTYVNSFRNGVYLVKEQEPEKKKLLNEGLNETVRLTRKYRSDLAPEIQPKEVEQKFRVQIPGIQLPLFGILDLIVEKDGEEMIRDFKTANRSWPEGRINEEIQPVFSTFLFQKERGKKPKFHYDVLVALKDSEKVQDLTYEGREGAVNALGAKIMMMQAMMDAGIFPPATPGHWACSEQFCGYWRDCAYVGNGRRKWI